jgi:hypothetical protein
MAPDLSFLPAPQQQLWQRLGTHLGAKPQHFVLYAGTALALRLHHRHSVDLDFFCAAPFRPQALLAQAPCLRDATVLQESQDTVTWT